MFNKLKNKLNDFKKTVTDVISKKNIELEPQEEPPKTVEKKPSVFKKIKTIVTERELIINEKSLEQPLWELEMVLLESDVALPVSEEIIKHVKNELIGKNRKISSNIGEIVESALKNAISNVISVDSFDFDDFIKNSQKPVKIMFVGVNGTGKTTTIAKLGKYFKKQGYSVVIAAADTFRAGAIEQLEQHANNLGIKLIKHQQGSDPAAVVYDAVQYSKAKHKDIVLADTAGRMHKNVNLMDQLKKIYRVNSPDLVIFVDEAIAGNDAVERAKDFNDIIPINGTILTKQDADSKGGTSISISFITKRPILFLGTGQGYDDIVKFEPNWLIKRLFD